MSQPTEGQPSTNLVLETISDLVTRADDIYVPTGRSTMKLSDPSLPVKDASRFFRDRLAEL